MREGSARRSRIHDCQCSAQTHTGGVILQLNQHSTVLNSSLIVHEQVRPRCTRHLLLTAKAAPEQPNGLFFRSGARSRARAAAESRRETLTPVFLTD